ncbi:hypothetical protein CBR_g29848 [Chara braunii]|uniref:phospholipase D n=1 Tax=Chara braunii TaxID=69332 RepID=A0A388JWQ7_CHABU|nr:hypothetical protein CBR_g29848 [Chara braunii]|eukprot:GBG62241.1 hypothetical protein CBR_g29848 [Chara braunii]
MYPLTYKIENLSMGSDQATGRFWQSESIPPLCPGAMGARGAHQSGGERAGKGELGTYVPPILLNLGDVTAVGGMGVGHVDVGIRRRVPSSGSWAAVENVVRRKCGWVIWRVLIFLSFVYLTQCSTGWSAIVHVAAEDELVSTSRASAKKSDDVAEPSHDAATVGACTGGAALSSSCTTDRSKATDKTCVDVGADGTRLDREGRPIGCAHSTDRDGAEDGSRPPTDLIADIGDILHDGYDALHGGLRTVRQWGAILGSMASSSSSSSSHGDYILHGDLVVEIEEARGMKARNMSSGSLLDGVKTTLNSYIGGVGKEVELYASICIGQVVLGQTKSRKNTSEPRWDEEFHIYLAHSGSRLRIEIRNKLVVDNVVLAQVDLPADELLSGHHFDGWHDMTDASGQTLPGAHIKFSVAFKPALKRSTRKEWMARFRGPETEVQEAFFKQRKGCRVTLYQDAHVEEGRLPAIPLSGSRVYRQERAWEDLYKAILDAKHLIYITGWSVYTEIRLIRDEKRGIHEGSGHVRLGELLKRKAAEGVRVLLLVWDDRTSSSIVTKGVMSTHDEETMEYFKNTKVRCVLAPRSTDLVKSASKSMMFSHHQKAIVVDAAPVEHPTKGKKWKWGRDDEGSREGDRRLVAFVGGLDVTDGRFDTPSHYIFSTLRTWHKDDFYQPSVAGSASLDKGGPRQPWHDIHAKLEGPIAWDVLENFQQRWRKQASLYNTDLLPIGTPGSVIPGARPVTSDDDPDTWQVQLFRSIDTESVYGFPESPREAVRMGLVSWKDDIIDRSIQNAYIEAIRNAERFIYIENQYFMGSSHMWAESQGAGAYHTVAVEIALKIASKIRDGEPFGAYILVPMYPEGDPHLTPSSPLQEMLRWQYNTMTMMYKIVADALRTTERYDQHPTDYLNFFCIGARESVKSADVEHIPSTPISDAEVMYKEAQKNRRMMIYVHSKMMIVDDDYIIVGSANINQRSMDGGRDSEIAFGAMQPHHVLVDADETKKPKKDTEDPKLKAPKGAVHGFRMSLWAEHLGSVDKEFSAPWTSKCVRKVREMAERNWQLYVQPEPVDMVAHLMPYPLQVDKSGRVSARPGFEFFPDSKAKVTGTVLMQFPDLLTT